VTRERQFALALILIGWSCIFALTCDASGEGADQCAYQRDAVYSMCYAYGRDSPECVRAMRDLEMCRAGVYPTSSGGNDDPCEWERSQERAICRALGKNSLECRYAKLDLELCRIENTSDDPIEGASNFKWGSP